MTKTTFSGFKTVLIAQVPTLTNNIYIYIYAMMINNAHVAKEGRKRKLPDCDCSDCVPREVPSKCKNRILGYKWSNISVT